MWQMLQSFTSDDSSMKPLKICIYSPYLHFIFVFTLYKSYSAILYSIIPNWLNWMFLSMNVINSANGFCWFWLWAGGDVPAANDAPTGRSEACFCGRAVVAMVI